MHIYKVINNITGKIYIGKEKYDNKNYYGSGLLIKQSIKKYGKENFSKEILEKCQTEKQLISREEYWIDKLPCLTPEGYNISKKSWGGDIISRHPNKHEIINKIRMANTGKKRSKEFCIQIKEIASSVSSEIRLTAGRKAAETRRKRVSKKGHTEKELAAYEKNAKHLSAYNKTPEARERVSKQWKGKKKKPFSEEHRKNIGNASKGRKIPGKKIMIEKQKYDSLHEASRILGLSLSTIRNRLLSKNFEDWHYLANI